MEYVEVQFDFLRLPGLASQHGLAVVVHALICFLALLLYRVLRTRLKASNSQRNPKAVLEILRRIRRRRASLGVQSCIGIGKTPPERLDLLDFLHLPRT